ncbi:MAG: hypothetical protein QOI44_2299 [Actinomycetota bacterium]|nr:hypothetical protein [Actinomycetota bacterium]
MHWCYRGCMHRFSGGTVAVTDTGTAYAHGVAGTVLATALLIPLAIPGYMIGSLRWLRRRSNTWEIGSILFVSFFAWYVVLRLVGGSQVLVPVAMLACAAGFGAGRLVYVRALRKRR